MVTVTVDNSYSTIKGLSVDQERSLREALSYAVGGKSAFYSGFGVRKRSLLSKRGEFPTGLIPRLAEYFKSGDEWIDLRIKPLTYSKPFVAIGTPYAWQIAAVAMATECARGIISAPTGTGKTTMAKLLILKLGLKTLVVVPSIEIKKQFIEALGGLKNVVVENIDSPKLKTLTGFDCLIIDEAHHVAAKTYQKLNKTAWTGIYYRFFLTATPFRNDAEEQLLFESIAGQVIYKLDYQTAIKENYIVPVEGYYFDLIRQETDAYVYRQVYSELVVNNFTRNLLISSTLLKLDSVKKSVLCLVKEVKHGKILSDLTGFPFVSGEDYESRDYIRQFNSGEIKTIIGTTGILGEGVDTKPCEYVVIAGLGKAKSQFMQQVGRAVRKYPGKESAKVIIFRDRSHKFLLRHFNAQKSILKDEYGVVCQKLELE